MPKIKEYFSNMGDRIKTSVRVKPDAIFFYISIVLVIVAAILIRLSPIINGQILIKEFDPWNQFNSTQYILSHDLYDWIHYTDYQLWYPEGLLRSLLRPGLLYTTAFLYQVITILGIKISLMEFVIYFPAFMGGLAVFATYLLGKELLDRKCGLLAAFFLAFSPGHMQRTVAGFFDNETIGVLAILLVFLFYIKAVKTGKIQFGVISGIFMGYLALSWGGLSFPFLLMPLLTMILILADKYSGRALIAYSTTIGTGLLIYTLNPLFVWSDMIKSMEYIVPILFLIFLLIYHYLYLQKGSPTYENILTFVKWAAIPVGIAAAIIFFVKPEWIPFGLGGRLASIINPQIREKINIVASVGEHMPSPWSVFYFNAMIPVLLVIPGIYFSMRRGEEQDILMIIFVITLFYFTGSMVRIILVLAPALAVLGAYGLANILKYFGNLMKKEQTITRRRKRQIKRTVGISEGLVVYVFISILLFTQANQAINVSIKQLGYSELVAGGTFHDWEETLTWMKYNLPYSAVTVSWWDYGYWIRFIGNGTSVNDNGTLNSTRIGLTGMAMMQTNERYSAEIFRELGADYVLVYFGHLFTQLGGDEGKWPWMLRICNDHTTVYQGMGLEKENWYGGEERSVNTVFDENQYINSTSGAYRQNWFDSTLVKLMFADEPTTASAARTQTELYYATQIEGSTQYNTQARKADDGTLWSSKIPANGQYNFQFFRPAYYSANKLVKIFKVDYTALDSSFEITDTYLDQSGIGYAKIKNTGLLPISLKGLTVNGVELNFTQQKNDLLKANESQYVWFDTYQENTIQNETESPRSSAAAMPYWQLNQAYTVGITVDVPKGDGTTFTFENSSVSSQIASVMKSSSIEIDRELSKMEIKGDIQTQATVTGIINVKNNGDRLVKISGITANDPVELNNVKNIANGTFLIEPGTSETFEVGTNVGAALNLTNDVNVIVETAEGAKDETNIALNKPGHKITILSGVLQKLPEQDYLYNYTTYSPVSPNLGRYYAPFNEQTRLWENGTLQLTVRNDGTSKLAIQGLTVDDKPIYDFNVSGGYWPEPGESRVITAQIPNVVLNMPMKVFIMADAGDNATYVAADSVNVVPQATNASITILKSNSTWTAAFTNESIRVVVKNTGITTVNLNEIAINGSNPYTITDANIVKGSKVLEPFQIAVLSLNYTNLKVNMSNYVQVAVSTNITGIKDEAILEARLPTKYSNLLAILEDRKVPSPDLGTTDFTYGTTAEIHLVSVIITQINVTIDGFYIGTSNTTYQLINLANVTIKDKNATVYQSYELDGRTPYQGIFAVYTFTISSADLPIAVVDGTSYWFKINTVEGYYAEIEVEIGLL
jgi:dolichyl-diphosphooligosaccharide--protein glycosyltransferase